MKKLSVSIAVCSKNRSTELRKLTQLLNTQYFARDAEIIVVEDVSDYKDSPPAVIGVDVYYAMKGDKLGFGAVRQKAVELATGEVIVFIDDDCLPSEGWLNNLLQPFEDCEVVAVGGGILPQEGNMIAKATALLGLPAGGLPRLLSAGETLQISDALSTGNLALRLAAVTQVGGFDVRHRHGGEDQVLVEKLVGKKYFNPTALVKHRNRDSFSEIWLWFVRRGAGEYKLNRLKGMSAFSALFTPWRWSWSWRILILLLIGCCLGAMTLIFFLLAYYFLLLYKVIARNKGDVDQAIIQESKRECVVWPTLLLAPILRVWMDIAREVGRLKFFLKV